MEETAYAWQKECIDRWLENHGRGIVCAATGSGKTRFALMAVQRLREMTRRELQVRIVVPTAALMNQWEKNVKEAFSASGEAEKQVGCFGGARKDPETLPYMIYVIHSARYRLARNILEDLRKGRDVLLIADECHHYASEQNRRIFEFLPFVEGQSGNYYALGLSATPKTPGYEEILMPALGKEIYRYGMERALERKTLCSCMVYHIALSFSPEERDEYEELSDEMIFLRGKLIKRCPWLSYAEGAAFFAELKRLAGEKDSQGAQEAGKYLSLIYRRKRLACMAEARLICVPELLRRLDAGSRILIFGERIEQADRLYGILKEEYGGQIGRYHSQMGKQANKNALRRFREGEARILITCKALDEGLDVPDADAAIVLSGTSVERQRLQRMGRVLRQCRGKEIAALYYLFVRDSMEEHAYILNQGGFQTASLYFDAETGEFSYPDYEDAANQTLLSLRDRGAGDELHEEAVRCLQRGLLRPDWRLPPETIRERAGKAKTVGEKNYWICMGKLGKVPFQGAGERPRLNR